MARTSPSSGPSSFAVMVEPRSGAAKDGLCEIGLKK
jgi:hypothetical protein